MKEKFSQGGSEYRAYETKLLLFRIDINDVLLSLSPAEIKAKIEEGIKIVEGHLSQLEEKALSKLNESFQRLKRDIGAVSPLCLAAETLAIANNTLLTEALSNYTQAIDPHSSETLYKQARDKFAYFYDTCVGIIEISSMLQLAEESIRGEVDASIAAKEDSTELFNALDPIGQVNAHLDMTKIARESRQLLEEDKTGFLLVDRKAQQITEKFPFNPKEWAVGGAQIGALIYKSLYPKAVEMLKNFNS
ncbi:MAG: hypothetical protein HY424_00985 [Candidatus Levybacteria bacterium]|nr:hypothetical protein [Candidatus Levybacteria bacterium]